MFLQFIIVMAIAGAVFWFVLWPLRPEAPDATPAVDPRLYADRDRAQLAKDRKLDEIRELRADRAAGKLQAADAAPLERALRAEAADLLHALDRAEAAIDEAEIELGIHEPIDEADHAAATRPPAEPVTGDAEPLR